MYFDTSELLYDDIEEGTSNYCDDMCYSLITLYVYAKFCTGFNWGFLFNHYTSVFSLN